MNSSKTLKWLMDANTLLETVKARLKTHEGSYAVIVRDNPDISYSSLTKLAHGQTENPTINSLQQIIEALDRFEGVEPAHIDLSSD